MPKFCPTCGKQLQYENAEICPSCGVRIQALPPTQTSSQMDNRNPWVAVILSFFCAGWGQWYNGKTWDGLKFFGTILILYIFAWVFLVIAASNTSLSSIYLLAFILFIVVIVIWIYGMYDAYKTAEKINRREMEFAGKSALFWLPVALIIIGITIIFAAIVAAFVFGMAGNIQHTKVVAVTAQNIGNNIVITYQGGEDAASLQSISISINGANAGEMSIPSGSYRNSLAVGTSATFPVTGTYNHVVAIGHFTDGTNQVIFDQTL